jgi:hypothetical protein
VWAADACEVEEEGQKEEETRAAADRSHSRISIGAVIGREAKAASGESRGKPGTRPERRCYSSIVAVRYVWNTVAPEHFVLTRAENSTDADDTAVDVVTVTVIV